MDREDIRMLVEKWWDIYNDVPGEDTFSRPPIMVSMPEPVMEYLYLHILE